MSNQLLVHWKFIIKKKIFDTVYVEANVPNIDSNNYKLELIDAPGVNNAYNNISSNNSIRCN